MKQLSVKIDRNGRVLIPNSIRKSLELKTGNELIIDVQNNNIVLHSSKQALKKLQDLVTSKYKKGESLVDALIEMRRKEEI